MGKGKTEALLMLMVEEYQAASFLGLAFPRQTMYQASQAAEKGVRAILEIEGIPIGTTHNFGQFAGSLPMGHPLRTHVLKLDVLSSASTRYRYNRNEHEPDLPDDDEVEDALALVKAFCERVGQYAVGHDPTFSTSLTPVRRQIDPQASPLTRDLYRRAKRETVDRLLERIGRPMDASIKARLDTWTPEQLDQFCMVLVTAAESREPNEFAVSLKDGLVAAKL